MVLDPNRQQRGGAQDPPADNDKDKQPDDQVKKPDDAKRSGEGPDDPITPQRLTQVLDARQRKAEAELKKIAEEFNKPLSDKLSALTEKLEGLITVSTAPEDKKKKGEEPSDKEIIEYRRRLDELESKLAIESERRAQSEQREKDYKFKTKVTNELVTAGCTKPEIAYLAIKPYLKVDDKDPDRIYSHVESDYGTEELELPEYIKRVFAEDTLPELFAGKMRSGSPAGGDSGDGGAYTMTKEEVFDAKRYLANPEKYRDAIERGLVKGVPSRPVKK